MLPFITIIKAVQEPSWAGWSYSIEELPDLVEERAGETFYLWGGRLYEKEEQ